MNQWAADVADTAQGTKPTSYQTEQVAHKVSPVLQLCRLMITSAFRDALQCKNGEPTPTAVEAVAWIEARTDWTLKVGCPIPPASVRKEFPGSFDWACRWLNEDPDRVRQVGLPPSICRAGPPRKYGAMRSRPVRIGGHQCPQTNGLPDVFSRWEAARAAHAAKQTEAKDQTRTKPGVANGAGGESPVSFGCGAVCLRFHLPPKLGKPGSVSLPSVWVLGLFLVFRQEACHEGLTLQRASAFAVALSSNALAGTTLALDGN